jgi:CheY-like chemotaxis protein
VAHILIIDDDAPFRALLLEMLETAGHTAVAVPNGFEGLKHFRANPADLILTDIMMPYGGLATIRMIRGEFPDIGIIAMSGGGTFRLDYARGFGAHSTLTKPFTAEQLTSAVDEVMSTRPKAKPEA